MSERRSNISLSEAAEIGFSLAPFAAVSALKYSRKYRDTLRISSKERKRYYSKSARQAACYAGFSQKLSLKQAAGAGKAAFLTCAYDVATDWGKPPGVTGAFIQILDAVASPHLVQMSLKLMERDLRGELEHDGLERGIVALRFVLEMMGLEEAYKNKGINIDKLGMDLQIVDDVLDFEEDRISGDTNCLFTPRRDPYLLQMTRDLRQESVASMFPYAGALKIAINNARDIASDMLACPVKYF